MEKFVCVHGHFYQPPRENPWLEAVERQDSAQPYHDWNERITAECYAPNAHTRFLDESGRISRIVSNYSKMSFNFGPTLLSWMKEQAGDIYQAILDADKEAQQRYSGHGSALAQCYNHLIMPLANPRDQYTQALWGVRDFEFRFGRQPEGMWLPECAADTASLEVLAALGIQFTILSPFQASRVRPIDKGEWQDVNGGRLDPTRPYLAKLPSGRSMTLFFYDAPVSQAVAFERLLMDGGRFARRLMDGFDEGRNWDQLVHIATDGESYGHHHRYGEMALAYAMHEIESKKLARLTVYGEYLAKHPPTHEVTIHSPSAWSCSHQVARWHANCGCNAGHPGWNQEWRKPLRNALDWLRDELSPRYEARAKEYLKDPWAARDEYISVILDRTADNRARFLSQQATRPLTEEEQVTTFRLLELQRHAMLMYTSCGWFFDELSGIETVQVIQYAARAIQLAHDLFNESLEEEFAQRLAKAKSNIREHRDGRVVYEKFVKPAMVTRETVGAHFAISSLFKDYPEEGRIYSFTIKQEDRQLFTVGGLRLAIGRIKVLFEVTQNFDVLSYGVLHLGEHNLNCGIRYYEGPEAYAAMMKEMCEVFERADFAGVLRTMDRHFGESHYSLKTLFRDEQHKVLNQILASTHEDLHNAYRQISDRYSPLIRFLGDIGAPVPKELRMAVEYVINSELRQQFEGDIPDAKRVQALLEESQYGKIPLDHETLSYAIKNYLDRLCEQLSKTPEDLVILERLELVASLINTTPFDVNLWKPQNIYFNLQNTLVETFQTKAAEGDASAKIWLQQFTLLGQQLGFRLQSS